MMTQCPECHVATYCISRTGYKHEDRVGKRKPAGLDGIVLAANRTGICYTCHRRKTGWVPGYAREASLKADRNVRRYRKTPFTLADLEYSRRALARMLDQRRGRGVPVQGSDPAALGNGGLFASEVA